MDFSNLIQVIFPVICNPVEIIGCYIRGFRKFIDRYFFRIVRRMFAFYIFNPCNQLLYQKIMSYQMQGFVFLLLEVVFKLQYYAPRATALSSRHT